MLIYHDSPLGALSVPALGVTVEPNTPIDVPGSIAGSAPGEWQAVEDGRGWRDDGNLYRLGESGWERRTSGSGLLAQSDVWHVSEGN